MYKIIGISSYGKEAIDEAKDLQEAQYLVNEYMLAFDKGWSIYYIEV